MPKGKGTYGKKVGRPKKKKKMPRKKEVKWLSLKVDQLD